MAILQVFHFVNNGFSITMLWLAVLCILCAMFWVNIVYTTKIMTSIYYISIY